MKYRWCLMGVSALLVLSACQQHDAQLPPSNPSELVENFLKPAGDKGALGVIFNAAGDVIAVTAKGQVLKPCRVPRVGEQKKSEAVVQAEDGSLPVCQGLIDTTVYNVSQFTVIKHKGSTCETVFASVGGTPLPPYQWCGDDF
jgi:hypothetical protein